MKMMKNNLSPDFELLNKILQDKNAKEKVEKELLGILSSVSQTNLISIYEKDKEKIVENTLKSIIN
jgi:hypothetical protein